MKTPYLFATTFIFLCVLVLPAACVPPPPPQPAGGGVDRFLANYTNPEQQKVPADGLYPFGQRMWLSGYSNNKSELIRMKNAGFTLSGPHYSAFAGSPDHAEVDKYGMKTFYRLRISNYKDESRWPGVLPQMKTPEGRENVKNQIVRMIKSVLDDPLKNRVVAAWYGYPEEPMKRSDTPLSEQRAYIKFVQDIIESTDTKRRPYFVSERGDSSQYNMIGNAAYTSGVMKQNYLIKSNAYGGDNEQRFLMGQWVRDEFAAANQNDAIGLSYTGKKRPVISTLSMYIDPDNQAERNEAWLRKTLTHDFYLQVAMGAHGFNLYTWSNSSSYSQKTKDLQENLYLEIIGKFAKSGLGKVFLWGDDRTDIKMEITDGPKTFQWKKYKTWFTEPSIKFRNIQYGKNRYILLVNSSKEVVRPRLSGFPSGMIILDMIPNKWYTLGSTVTPTLQPNDVRMYKIEAL